MEDPNSIEVSEKLETLISFQYAIGAVRSQNGHTFSFASRTLNSHDRNYSATGVFGDNVVS